MSILNRPFESSQHIIGAAVRDPNGDRVGTIDDLIFDTVEGRIAYIHLDLEREGKRNRVVVPWSALSFDARTEDGWRIAAQKETLDRFAGLGKGGRIPDRPVGSSGSPSAARDPAATQKE